MGERCGEGEEGTGPAAKYLAYFNSNFSHPTYSITQVSKQHRYDHSCSAPVLHPSSLGYGAVEGTTDRTLEAGIRSKCFPFVTEEPPK